MLRVANTRMAGAVRMVSLSLGADPRDFALFAFGGAGPLHASALARELGIPRVLVPARPGITNALGCVVADLRHDFVNTLNRPLDLADIDAVHRVFAQQEAEGRRLIGDETVAVERVEALFSADMKFIGQTHQLRVPLPDGRPTRAAMQAAFERVYRDRFHVDLPEIRAAIVNLNCSVIGRRPPVDLSALIDASSRRATLAEAESGCRRVRFGDDWHETPIYRRDHLPAGAEIDGPAIVEQLDATTVIEPGDRAAQDGDGNLLVTLGAVVARREPALMAGVAR